MSRKFEAIDLMKLYAQGSANGWNEMLNDCVKRRDINKLLRINYQLQAGMDDLAKNGLNQGEILEVFPRWTKSLESTAKKILKLLEPNPLDNPVKALQIKNNQPMQYKKYHELKKSRDEKLSAFRKKSSY